MPFSFFLLAFVVLASPIVLAAVAVITALCSPRIRERVRREFLEP